MTPERFHAIVDAYGADPRRWPAAERASAQAWASRHREEADAVLAESAWLDASLSSDAIAPAGRALYRRIVAGAPLPEARARGFFPSRGRLWWSGAAIAGIGLAGGLAGAFAVSFVVLTGAVPPVSHEAPDLTTSFGTPAADWSGE
jgi:hypothetical protein